MAHRNGHADGISAASDQVFIFTMFKSTSAHRRCMLFSLPEGRRKGWNKNVRPDPSPAGDGWVGQPGAPMICSPCR